MVVLARPGVPPERKRAGGVDNVNRLGVVQYKIQNCTVLQWP